MAALQLEFYNTDYDDFKFFGIPDERTFQALATAMGLKETMKLEFPKREEYLRYVKGNTPRSLGWAYDEQSDTWYCLVNGITQEEILAAAANLEC